MNVVYTDVAITPHDGKYEILARAENTSGQPWREEAGFAFGIHIFDRETETLIIDGPRMPVYGEVGPGESIPVAIAFHMPPQPGKYRIYLSPMAEGEAWFYETGWRFILIEASVNESAASTIERCIPYDQRKLKIERAWRALGRAFVLPIQSIWHNRSLMRSMVRRDILGRYRGSLGGWFWTVLNPLLLMATYFFVFGVVMQTKVSEDKGPGAFALYLIAGMLPWLAFSEAIGRAPSNMWENRQFIKKLRFPVETLPVNIMLSGLTSEVFGLAIYLSGLLLLRGGHLPLTVLWLPVLVLPQMLLTAGLCWLLAALGVFIRDLAQVIGFVLTLWFFLTPICYSEAGLPEPARSILAANPIYVLVHGYRTIFLAGHQPDWSPLWKLYVLSAAVFFLGHALFYKLRKSFADIV